MRADSFVGWIFGGALAGLFGGIVFGAAMLELGAMTPIALIARVEESFAIGLLVHMTIAGIVGAIFAVLVRHQNIASGEMLFWGTTYAVLWWFIGPLTLRPLIMGSSIGWDLPTAQNAFASLLGHVLYGATLGLSLHAVRGGTLTFRGLGPVLRGAVSGLVSAAIVGRLLGVQGRLPVMGSLESDASETLAWIAVLLVGVVGGALFALMVHQPGDSAGANLVRGSMYGFLLWIVITRTLIPLIGGRGLLWSLESARADFAGFFAYTIFGGFMALGYQWLSALWKVLFSDELGGEYEEGAGTRGLRAIWRGTMAGVIGGLLFTFVMVQIGALEGVAALARAESRVVGLGIHFIISIIWGASYGLLFRRQAYDVGSAMGWGLSYGVFVWFIGPNTLMPILLGAVPIWTSETAASLVASLVGHLAYGVGLGLTFHYFEARFSPWWIPARAAFAERTERRREQLRTSGAAIWAMALFVGLAVPVLLSSSAGAPAPIYAGP